MLSGAETSAHPPRRFDAWDAAAFAAMVATTLLYTREIGNEFLWGHDGGNGASVLERRRGTRCGSASSVR